MWQVIGCFKECESFKTELSEWKMKMGWKGFFFFGVCLGRVGCGVPASSAPKVLSAVDELGYILWSWLDFCRKDPVSLITLRARPGSGMPPRRTVSVCLWMRRSDIDWRSTIRWEWCRGQKSRRCSGVSRCVGHQGQCGLSVSPSLHRWEFRRVCPMRSLMMGWKGWFTLD